MSHLKWLPVILLTALLTQTVQAEPSRTFYSLENQFPRWEQLEVGMDVSATEREVGFQDISYREVAVYARYGVFDNLAVALDLPFAQVDPDLSDTESGLGDMELRLQLRAYEDIFGYPFFIPYVNFSFPTGDEDKGLGDGDVAFTGGFSFGSKINDWIDWVIDLSYKVNSEDDNQFIVGHSYVWNISDDFALLTEVAFRQSELESLDDEVILAGGFNYNWNQNFEMGISVGVGSEDTSAEVKARISYSF
jgi:hypothetical protein